MPVGNVSVLALTMPSGRMLATCVSDEVDLWATSNFGHHQYGFIYFRASALETASNMRAQRSDSLQNVPAHASQIGWHFYVEPRADQLGNCKEQSERRHYKK